MRVLAFSDLHASARHTQALVEAAPQADLILGAGDFCNMRQGLRAALAPFAPFAERLVLVPGNNESDVELRSSAPEGAVVLHGAGTEIGGLRLFGLGGAVPVTPFGVWSFDQDEEDAARALARCAEADILITHAPPKGIADRTSTGLSVGSTAIHAAIERIAPRFALCGHVHDCWGEEAMLGTTRVVNLGPGPRFLDL